MEGGKGGSAYRGGRARVFRPVSLRNQLIPLEKQKGESFFSSPPPSPLGQYHSRCWEEGRSNGLRSQRQPVSEWGMYQ